MFNGYLFAVLDNAAKDKLNLTGYVVGYIKVKHQKYFLTELQSLHLTKNKQVELIPANWLSKGIEVMITDGALKGMTGVVESHNKISEVHLQVNVLRQAVLVKIDPKYVKTIGEYSAKEHAE
jgi:transcription antitermination factor NusG